MRDEIEKFQQAGIRPFGVNPATVAAHVTYVAKFKFPFPLLSDGDRGIARAYHALKDDGVGIQRTVYVVRRGGGGTVAYVQRGAPPVDDIVAAVAGETGAA